MVTLLIFVVFTVIGFVVFGIADLVGHRLYNNHIRKQCGIPKRPVLKVARR